MNDPDLGSWSYVHDDNGNVVSQTDGRGVTLTMAYDGLDRPTSIARGASTLSTFRYDVVREGLRDRSVAYTADGPVVDEVLSADVLGRPTQSRVSMGSL